MLLDRKVYPVIEIALPETETGCGSQLACRAARQISLPPSSEVNCMGLHIWGTGCLGGLISRRSMLAAQFRRYPNFLMFKISAMQLFFTPRISHGHLTTML